MKMSHKVIVLLTVSGVFNESMYLFSEGKNEVIASELEH